MTTARPTVGLIAHIDPELKEWVKTTAQTQGISQTKFVEKVLNWYRNEMIKHWEATCNSTDTACEDSK